MDKRVRVDAIYTDFSKAFDKISHRILIDRLADVGVSGFLLRWIWSYLRDREQVVTVNGYQSNPFDVPSGVPQGSHLGPLFFIIYLNDIGKCFLNCKFLLYADDLKMFCPVEHPSDCQKIQEDLDRLAAYCSKMDLFLNLEKCVAITYTRNKSFVCHSYLVNNTQLKTVSEIKDLGVIMDSKLLFKFHIEKIINESNKMLGFIKRNTKYFRNFLIFSSHTFPVNSPLLLLFGTHNITYISIELNLYNISF